MVIHYLLSIIQIHSAMKKVFLPAIALLLLAHSVISQKIDIPPHFYQLLGKARLEFFEPLDAGYKDYRPAKNEFQDCHFAIRSSKEDMDIRYFVIPWNEDNPNSVNPHVSTFATLSNVATNADEAVISAIQPAKETLLQDFNADWGMTYFFTPKEAFSDKKNCRLTALCKEGQGTVFIFYLFNDAGNEALETRYLALRFL